MSLFVVSAALAATALLGALHEALWWALDRTASPEEAPARPWDRLPPSQGAARRAAEAAASDASAERP